MLQNLTVMYKNIQKERPKMSQTETSPKGHSLVKRSNNYTDVKQL